MSVHDPLSRVSTRSTPQSQRIPGRTDQVLNAGGGYVFEVDPWMQLRRFLILGTTGGTFYVSEKDQTEKNIDLVSKLIAEDGKRVVDLVVEVSVNALAPKPNPAIFTLALASASDDVEVRRYALGQLSAVCRTGYHLFKFVTYLKNLRGAWGRAPKRAIAEWYAKPREASNAAVDIAEGDVPDVPADVLIDALMDRHVNWITYQLAKYKQREGWAQADVIRLAHPKVGHGALSAALSWARGNGLRPEAPALLHTIDGLTDESTEAEVLMAINSSRSVSWEMIPSPRLKSKRVWEALLPTLPLTALIRNLGRLAAYGVTTGLEEATGVVIAKLTDAEYIERSRIHPMGVMLAAGQYAQGRGDKGDLRWTPVPRIIDALDTAFSLAFRNVTPANKRTLIAIDVSGSMDHSFAGTNISCRAAAGAMALITVKTEPLVHAIAFADGHNAVHAGYPSRWGGRFPNAVSPVNLSPRAGLADTIRSISGLPMGGTDCSLPMRYALERNLKVDSFVIYTDNETWYGPVHPVQALQEYRRKTGIDARLTTVAFVSTEHSIADPKDAGMLDVVGFDSAAPAIIANFAAGRI